MSEEKNEEESGQEGGGKHDGVNRSGLDYRAGWVEGLRAFVTRLNLAGIRATKKEVPGMDTASRIATEMFKEMLAKMRSGQ